ncbi:MAG TPA: mevalonate kinase [Nitrososphaeraceae archaeon]|nr:mevalonate kinase [Nitrososphaeraceae archaeon]
MDFSYRSRVHASAPGKAIIFGEHFVVYNNKAIVAAINRRCIGIAKFTSNPGVQIVPDLEMDHNLLTMQRTAKTNKRRPNKEMLEPLKNFCHNILKEHAQASGLLIHIKSELPIGVGLGSSAALSVMLAGIMRSIIRRTTNYELSSYDRKWVFENALGVEQEFHNKSSGVDCYVSTYGGLVHFRGLTGSAKATSIKIDSLPLFLINTRKGHETSKLVSRVRSLSRNRSDYFNRLASDASAICASGVRALTKGSLEEVGRLMTENHKLLRDIGVSNKEIEKVIGVCVRSGSLGAKITGAGGGGCILVLARPDVTPALSARLKVLNLRLEKIDVTNNGLIVD